MTNGPSRQPFVEALSFCFHMSLLAGVAPRVLFVVLCLYALVRSLRMGVADSLARPGKPEQIARAIGIEPRNTQWRARLATLRYQQGDASPETLAELESASASRPYDSEPLMSLGLLAEQRGDLGSAEKYLQHAVEIDHRFKPAWTIANFYYRTGQMAKMRPHIVACLNLIEPRNLEPWSFDPGAVFSLAWLAWDNPEYILPMIPRRRETLVPFLAFLSANASNERYPDAPKVAMKAWPDIIRLAETADIPVLLTFLDQALRNASGPGGGLDTVRVWNDMLRRGFVPGKALEPQAGKSLGDADFDTQAFEHGFGWRTPYSDGVVTSHFKNLLTLEFTGGESEHLELLSTYAALLPGRRYRMHWLSNSVAGPGLHSVVGREELAGIDGEFTAPEATGGEYSVVPIRLVYQRPAGQMRLRSTLALRGLRLEPLP